MRRREPVRVQILLSVFLLLQLLVHASVHELSSTESGPPRISPSSDTETGGGRREGRGLCLTCRTSSGIIAVAVVGLVAPARTPEAAKTLDAPTSSYFCAAPLTARAPPLA